MEINLQLIRELVHQRICGEMNGAYRDLFKGIKQDWKQLKHVIEQQIPACLPNKIIHSPYRPRKIVAPMGRNGILENTFRNRTDQRELY